MTAMQQIRVRFFAAALLVPFLLLAACAVHEGAGAGRKLETAKYRITVHRGLAYTPQQWPQRLQLDVFMPRGIGPFPAVVLLHGGGWTGGERKDMADTARSLAEKGYAAVALDYRLAPRHRFPAPLHDVQLALHWLRRKAETYGIDPQRIAVFGYDAGAQLAALIGTINADHLLDRPYGGPDTRVQAVIAGGLPSDLVQLRDHAGVRQLLNGGPQDQPQEYALASPINHVSADDAPFFLYHGSWDQVVPVEQGRAMQRALAAFGVPVEFYAIRGFGHAVTALFDGGVVEEAIAFLDRHLRDDY